MSRIGGWAGIGAAIAYLETFHRSFKRQVGVTPSENRRRFATR
jgi:transcriptional regulator GlxA family with amidase domain